MNKSFTPQKYNKDSMIAIQRLQAAGFDGQRASLWVSSRLMEGLNPLEELNNHISLEKP